MSSQFEHLDIEFERINSLGTAEILLLKGEGGVISEEVKQALLECFQNVAWVNEHGQEYVDALRSALYPPAMLVSISAIYTQSEVVYPTDTLDDLRDDLVVTATYSDGTVVIAPTYVLSGTLEVGDSVITVSYGGKTTTFTVEVSRILDTYSITNNLTGASNSNSATFITEEDSYSATITANPNHTLVGATVSITMGGVDITSTAYDDGEISIDEVTGDIVINVVAVAIVLESITAVYTQSGTVYDTDSLDSLKADLVVTAHFDDSSTEVVTAYTLSGTLEVGTSTITVSYGGKTTTFNVTVSPPTREMLFGQFIDGYGLAKTSSPSTYPTYGDYAYRKVVSARATTVVPFANKGYVFTVTDSSKYNILANDVLSITELPIPTQSDSTDKVAYGCGDKTATWGATTSVTTPYVWLALKKNDNTAFTNAELANGAEAVFTFTKEE